MFRFIGEVEKSRSDSRAAFLLTYRLKERERAALFGWQG
jgi:hypothetical protein